MDMKVGAVSLIMDFPSDDVEITDVILTSDPESGLQYSIKGNELRIGWYSLAPVWLNEGESRLGSAEGNTIQLPGGPDYWGSVFLNDDELRFVRADDERVTVNGEFPAEVLLVADTEGEPTVVQSGSIRFHPIFRESYALRIKDSTTATRLNFAGVENFDIQWTWRIESRFILAEEGETIEIGNVLGQLSATPVYGYFEFERNGKAFRMVGLGDAESESIWFIFADRTSGHSTYGAGRFLYSDGMPAQGRLVLDFNKAYNPPCAFNDYSTCPLPPQESRLNLQVTAGEKDFHHE